MRKERTLYYRKPIVLTEDRLIEVHQIVLKRCSHIAYSATAKDGLSIEFSSFDELQKYSNFGKERITSLIIEGRLDDYSRSIIITFSPSFPYKRGTVSYRYAFNDSDMEAAFVKEMQVFLEKATEYNAQFVICEALTLLVLYAAVAVFSLIWVRRATAIPIAIAFSLSLCYIATFIFDLISKYFWKKIFPSVVYCWGEEKQRYENHKDLRSKIFWVVIVGILIAFVVGYYFKIK
ncbi:MAG: hypothetical protein IKT09_08335 [Synergistes sp.]|nr:hypothetical protein [Synergistes sp.]